MMPFYAVGRGRHTGVFNSWAECQQQVKGFSGAKYKKFSAEEDAWSFVNAAAPQAVDVPKAKQKPLPAHLATKQSGPPRQSILLDDIPSHGIGGVGYQKPAPSSNLPTKEAEKAHILKKLDVISLEMQKLHNTALGLQQKLKGEDETGSSDQAPHTSAGKRQSEEQCSESNKRQRGQKQEESAPSSNLPTKEAEKAHILKKLDVISLEMQKLHNTALGLQQKLKGEDETGSSDQAPHTSAGKRQSEEQCSESNKRQRGQKQEESDLFSGSDADLAKAFEDTISVYTDGCCQFNGRNKAAAGIGVYWGPDDPNNVAARLQGRQTNNRAEIQAVCKALQQAKQMRKTSVIVYTDSQFLINSMTKWIHKWKRNGWKLTDGTSVKNMDDFKELDELQEGMTVKYVHVKGHSGVHGNEQADQLANQGARKPYHKNLKFSFEESDDSDY